MVHSNRESRLGIGVVGALTAASVLLLAYYIARLAFFLAQPHQNVVTFIFASAILLAESFLLLHSAGFLINIFKLHSLKGKRPELKPDIAVWPSVAVALPVKNEKHDIVEQTIVTLKALEYPDVSIYFVDDSDDKAHIAGNQRLAEKYNVHYFRPKNLATAKAGAVNELLYVVQAKYLALFDADQNPMPSFLKETVAVAQRDEKIAFVQTPQFYYNTDASPIAGAAAMQQSIFFEVICEAKSSVNAMFCCGTNVLLRTEALKKVGGFDQHSVTEDFSTSIALHLAGYRSVYLNHVQVFGMAPENLHAYFKQQGRWASGTVQILKRLVKQLILHPRSLSALQWWEYFLSSSFYFVGWVFLIFLLCPVLFLFFGFSTYFVDPAVYLATFVPYYILTSIFLYAAMKRRNYPLDQVYRGSILAFLTFPVLITALAKGLLNKKMAFTVTPKGDSGTIPLASLWPWHVAIALNMAAIIAGGFKMPGHEVAVGINIAWCAYHVFLLSYVYYFNAKPKRHVSIINEKAAS